MKWPKDRKRAFLWAAEAFGTPHENRTEKQILLTSSGICWAIRILTNSKDIYAWARAFRYRISIFTGYWWKWRGQRLWTPSCDKERSTFCYQMADLSDKEFEELST